MATHDNAPGVLIYNGRPYAVGLLWFTVQEEAAKELLQSRVRKTHADFYCQRLHISQQQAFGWLDKGHRRGMPVAASMVADQLVGEWHGVFEADNGWWYVQVRSDTITPNGDRFFTTEEEAFNVFQDEMVKHNWPHAYAPDKWRLGDRGIRELPLKTLLDELVTASLTPANITAVFGSASVRNVVMGGLAIAFAIMLAIAGYNAFLKPEPPQPVRRVNIQQILAMKKINQDIQIVSPRQLARTCAGFADQLFTPLPGWQTKEFVCGATTVSMKWQQTTGALGDAKERGQKSWPPNARINFAKRELTVSATTDKLPTVEVEELMTQESELLYLEQVIKPMGMLQVTPITPPAPAAPRRSSFLDNTAPPPPPKAPPAYLSILLKSGFAPEKIAPLIEMNGLEMTDVKWSVQQGMWEYKLKWYFQRTDVKTPPARPAAGSAVAPAKTPISVPANGQNAGGQKK